MDRRQFLVLTGSGAAAAAVTAWLGCSQRVQRLDLGRVGPVEPRGEKPLLALLVPPQESEQGALRGEIVGGALNHGGDVLLADFASVDFVCVTPERVPPKAQPVGEPLPWFLLLTREGGKTTSRAFTPSTPLEHAAGGLMGRGEYEQLDEAARARVKAFVDELHAFLLPVVGDPGQERASRAAAARRRYVEAPPPGAHWASSHGCGLHVEGVKQNYPMVACGMGMVPEIAQRFLTFYVKA